MINANCLFPTTNENIYAVRKGLKPTKGDNIYSICGGGDIPFMLIDNGARVLAVDYNENQLNFVKKRIHDLKHPLKKNPFQRFKTMSDENVPRAWSKYSNDDLRDKYFSQIKINSIIKNLENLTIKRGNFFNLDLDFSTFNKVYTSNAPLYNGQAFDMMPDFVNQFNEGTLFYLTYRNCSKPLLNKFFESKIAKENGVLSKRCSSQDSNWQVSVFSKK